MMMLYGVMFKNLERVSNINDIDANSLNVVLERTN
jgi:hypothetical protein